MNRTTSLIALAGLVALSGCAGLGTFGDRYGDHRRSGDYYEDDDYGDRYGYDSGYYRAVQRDARDYADALDRYLRISNREERAVREILEYRAYELLEATRARDHARVYPFPRRPGRAERFWALADRDIARVLDRRYHEPYAYYNRYGADRYQEYYRYRRYDDRRGWVDTRPSRRTPRRADDARDRRDDARERREEARERREEARRDDRREQAARERRRADDLRAEQERERRRERAARERAEREREGRRDRRRAEDDKDKKDKRSSRRTPRRGNN